MIQRLFMNIMYYKQYGHKYSVIAIFILGYGCGNFPAAVAARINLGCFCCGALLEY